MEEPMEKIWQDLLNEFNKAIEAEKKEYDDFNIFKIERIYWKEVYMCRFLAALLNYGIKNNKDIIKSFFDSIFELLYDPQKTTTVRLEEMVDNQRRVDIVITHGDMWIPIEAKIYAKDQTDQCSDYYEESARRNGDLKHLLYYLTLDGHQPNYCNEKMLKKIAKIKWEDIGNWLISISDIIKNKSEKVACLTEMFIKAIKEMKGENMEKAIGFIIQNENNFRAAAELYNTYDDARTLILRKFMNELKNEIKNWFDEDTAYRSILKEQILSYDEDDINNFYKYQKSTYPYVAIFVDREKMKSEYAEMLCLDNDVELDCCIRVEIDSNLFVGICLPTVEGHENKNKLPNGWKEVGKKIFHCTESVKTNNWWVSWEYIRDDNNKCINFKNSTENDFYFSLCKDPDPNNPQDPHNPRKTVIEKCIRKVEELCKDIQREMIDTNKL